MNGDLMVIKPLVVEYEWLIGGLEHEFYDFPYIGNFIIPTDELIFFRGVGIPPTNYDWVICQDFPAILQEV